MVNMANRANVAVRLVTLKLCFRHDVLSLSSLIRLAPLLLLSLPASPEAWSG